ncbi:unnamed protein product [Heterobilharzia americana]|nr:unnamed protein product [Heterobilharzia americana]
MVPSLLTRFKFLQSDLFRGRVALVCLVLQNAAVVLVTRYSRARQGDMYFPSTAVVMSELVKLLFCLFLVFAEENFSLASFVDNLKHNIIKDPWDCILVSVPGMVYTIQNNLLFVGYSNLDAVSFQISYQLKIFTTAIFFRIILSKQLSRVQWLSLGILFTGVVLTQLNDIMKSDNMITDKQMNATNKASSSSSSGSKNLFFGLSSVVLACSCSGFAGVFFEKLLKTSYKSVAVRNIQLAFYGVTVGIITVYLKDGYEIHMKGFFYGYDSIVWIAILIQSLGGLLIAATIRYADNIRKGFASSLAIVLTFILSIFWFNFHPTILFFLGAILVIIATVVYSAYPPMNSPGNTITTHGNSNSNGRHFVTSIRNLQSEMNFKDKLVV